MSTTLFMACDDGDSDSSPADSAVDAAVNLDMAVEADMAVEPDMALPDMAIGDLGPDAAPIPNPPQIQVATARVNQEDNGLGLIITGMDEDNDVAGITIELFTPNGQLDGLRNPAPEGEADPCGDWSSLTPTAIACVNFDRLQQGLGNFEGIWSLGFPEGSVFERLVTMRVSVFDSAGERSQVVDAVIEDTPVVAEGEQCDLNRGINKCEAGNLCGAVAGGRRACQADTPLCPEFYGVIDLNSQPNATYSGDTTNQGSHGEGSCGGGSGDHVFSFTTTRPGRYRFAVDVDNPAMDDTVMWIRSHCAFADWKAELACADDRGRMDLSSQAELMLSFDQTVYIFVGGYQPPDGSDGWQGPYTVTAEYLGE